MSGLLRYFRLAIGLALLYGFVLTGCTSSTDQAEPPAVTPAASSPVVSESRTAEDDPADSSAGDADSAPAETDGDGTSRGNAPVPSVGPNEPAPRQDPPSSPAPADNGGVSGDETNAPAGKRPDKDENRPNTQNQVIEHYSNQRPLLMSIAVGDTKEQVETRYGKPGNHYVLGDETEPVTVYEYVGFSVGFGRDGKAVFVEVHSANVDPGLNGLKLGHTTQDAWQILGQPDTDTSYVMTYINKNVVLKLDIDPQTRTIQSIRLFSAD